MTETPTRSQTIMAHIFCVAQQFTSVTVYVLGKRILSALDVYHFVFLRTLFVIPIVLVASSLFTRKLSAFKMPWKTYVLMAASGFIGIFVSQSLVFVGLDKTTPTNTSIISAPCTPLFTALFSVLRGTDKMNIPKGFGFLSSLIGALLLLEVWKFEIHGKALGNILIMGSTVCNALNSIIQKHVLNEGHHPLVVQFFVCCVGLASYMVGYSWLGLFEHHSWEVIPGNVWMYISIVGIVATAIPWCVSIIALKHMSPLSTSVYVVLQPLIAGFIGIVMMGEVLTWIQLLGGGLVIGGLVLVNAQPIVQRIFYRSKIDFALLPQTEDSKETELQIITGDAKVKEEVNYELTKADTNAFVIEDGADYTSDESYHEPKQNILFTHGFLRHKHEHEKAEGQRLSVTLLHRPEAILISDDGGGTDYTKDDVDYTQDGADYVKDGADYVKDEGGDLDLSSAKKESTPTPREVA